MSEYLPPQFNAIPAPAEQQPAEPKSALAGLTVQLHQWLEVYDQQTPQDQARLRTEFDPLSFKIQVSQAIRYGVSFGEDFTDTDAQAYLALLPRLNEVVPEISGVPTMQSLLFELPMECLTYNFEHETALHGILAIEAEAAQASGTHVALTNFASLYYEVSGETHGRAYDWRTTEGHMAAGMPEYMRPIVEAPNFVYLALDAVPNRTPNETHIAFTDRVQAVERVLLERFTPVVGELSTRLRRSLDSRTLKVDGGGIIPMTEPEGGVDFLRWKGVMAKVIESTKGFASADLQFLYEKAKIVNFDWYSEQQLQRTLKVHRRDPKIIDRLKQLDVTLCLLDSYGDYNDSSSVTAANLEHEGLLISEVDHPIHPSRHLISLERTTRLNDEVGIVPSGIVVSAHTEAGVIYVGDVYSELEIVSDAKFASKFTSEEEVPYVDISKTKIGRLVCRLKPHSETGERYVTFDACGLGEFLYPEGNNIPEVILQGTTVEDRVVIRTMINAGFMRRVRGGEDHTFAYYDAGQKRQSTREFRVRPPEVEPHPIYPTDCLITEKASFRYV